MWISLFHSSALFVILRLSYPIGSFEEKLLSLHLILNWTKTVRRIRLFGEIIHVSCLPRGHVK